MIRAGLRALKVPAMILLTIVLIFLNASLFFNPIETLTGNNLVASANLFLIITSLIIVWA